MKKKLIAAALLLMVAACTMGGTWAYYVRSATAHNVITTSSVGISVEEWQDLDGQLTAYPDEPIPVMPGTRVSKIAAIRNERAESFVRACIEVAVTDRHGNTMVLSGGERDAILRLGINSEYWKRKHGDEKWWYYSLPLEQGEVTQPLLTDVEFDGPGMTNAYRNSTIRIHIAGQAVQTANNSASALTASGWPAE